MPSRDKRSTVAALFVCPKCGDHYEPKGPTGDQFFCARDLTGKPHAPVKMERRAE